MDIMIEKVYGMGRTTHPDLPTILIAEPMLIRYCPDL